MQGFVKHVVRSPLSPSTVESIAARTYEHLAARAETSGAKLTGDIKQRSSGLDPIEIIIILGTFVCVFVLLVLVGTLCKVFNRPRTEAHPYYGGNGLYHPSAAGYGGQHGPGSQAAARAAAAAAAGAGGPGSSTNLLSVEQRYNARASLLGFASPMGQGASPQLDDSLGDSSSHSVDDYFGMRQPSAAAGPSHAPHGRNASSNLGHSRGESSGIHLPGPSAVARRGAGTSGSHPALLSGGPSPDGGGFRPGQVVSPGAGYGSAGPGGPAPQLRAAPRGPPPATDARRRSKYARADGRRIDSVGPGVLRKSMFIGADDMPTDAAAQRMSLYNGGGRVARQTSGGNGEAAGNTSAGGLRRVDSVGRGDARRRSQAYPGGAGASARTPSMYGALANDRAMMRSAAADNFGAGRGGAAAGQGAVGRSDPLGAARNNGDYEPMDAAPSPSAGPPGAALKAGPRMPKQYPQASSYASSGAGGGQEQLQLNISPSSGGASPGAGGRTPRAMGPPSPGISPGMRLPHPQLGGYAQQAPLAAGGGRQLL